MKLFEERNKEFARYVEMLRSIYPTFEGVSTSERAQVVREILGMGDPHVALEMLAICPDCDWRGRIIDCDIIPFLSDGSSWERLAGREGDHYTCPICASIIWKHYSKIS